MNCKNLLIGIFLSVFMLSTLTMNAQNWKKINPKKAKKTQVQLQKAKDNQTLIKFEFNAYSEKTINTPKGKAVVLDMPNCTRTKVKGVPDLPKTSQSVIIPNRSEMKVKVIKSNYIELKNIKIAPSKGIMSRDKNPSDYPFTYGKVYSQNSFYPSEVASVNEPYLIRNIRGQSIMVHPVQYNPVTKTARIYTSLTVELTPSGKKGINTLDKKSNGQVSSLFHRIYDRHFINYNENGTKYTPQPEDGNKMLIVCYSNFTDEMQSYVNWKESIGFQVEMVDYSTIGSASALESYVQDYYDNNGLDFLLLVGDHAQVPASSTSAGDSDNNYGYVSGSDHYLDIFVGRFSAETSAEVTTQVERTISYERDVSSSASFINKGVGIASNEGGSGGDDGEDDETHMNNIEYDLENYGYSSVDRIYQDGGSASQLTSALNDGRGIINYVGHGSSTSWASMYYDNNDVNSLTNTGKLPFIFSVACVNGDFTSTTCFAETWLRATYNGNPTGAIAFCGSTINQSWASPMCAQDEMNDLMVTNNWLRYGGVFVNGMFQMIDEYGSDGENMADTWTVFGDPSVQMRTPGHPEGPDGGTVTAPVADFSAGSTTVTEGESVNFSDQSSNNPTTWEWSFEGGDPSTSTQQNPSVTYNTAGTYEVSLSVSNSAGSDSETKSNYITVEEYVPSYCASAGNDASYEWISSVDIGAFNYSSGSDGGYADYTSETVTLTQGATVDVTLTPGFNSSTYQEYWKIWIDFNNDKDFEDSGELVFSGNGSSAVSGSIDVPSTATGTTRMRITMKYNGEPSPCETFDYGEVEDYTVTFEDGGGGDTEAPTAPSNLVSGNVTETSVDLSWDASSDNVGVDHYTVFQDGNSVGTTANTSYSVTGLTAATTYTFTVKAEDAAGNVSAASNALDVTTNDGSITYCESKGNNSSYEWISQVEIGSFSNSSGAAGYTDFTGQTVNLSAGSSVNVTLTPEFSGSSYNEYWKIWIDYNGDGDFTDNGELAFDAGSMSSSAVSGTMNVASTASGSTRMRITMKYNGEPSSCETFSYGEVEDYTVSFSGGGEDTEAPTAPTNLATSNVTESSVDLTWSASSDNVGVDHYTVFMDGSSMGTTTNTSYSVTGLAASTTYTFTVEAEDAAGNVSAASTSLDVTTDDGGSVSYCESNGQNTNYEWIDLVELGSINNSTSSDGGYGDYTNLSTDLTRGSNATIYISAGFASSSYTEYWHVWIDFDQNGTFDSDEEMVSGSSSSADKLSASFDVPTDAVLGQTRMRVTMKYNSAATACESFSYGEVEDYTVNITDNSTNYILSNRDAMELGNAPAGLEIYPNPANSFVNVQINEGERNSTVSIYNTQGSLVKIVPVNSDFKEIDVSDLQGGVYILKVADERLPLVKQLIKK